MPTMGESYQKNVLSKVPMILSAMHAHMDKKWVMWMDDDTWFNPGVCVCAQCVLPLPLSLPRHCYYCYHCHCFYRRQLINV